MKVYIISYSTFILSDGMYAGRIGYSAYSTKNIEKMFSSQEKAMEFTRKINDAIDTLGLSSLGVAKMIEKELE